MSKLKIESSARLINGLIPAGTACPFLNNCKFKVYSCPGVDGKTKVNNFSCAAARLHDSLDEMSLKRVQRSATEEPTTE